MPEPVDDVVARQRRIFGGGPGVVSRAVLVLLLGSFTLSHLAADGAWVFLDGVNVAFHEAGHLFLAWAPETLHILGGTLGQLACPVGLGLYFHLRRRDRFAAVACAWWVGENLVNIARYVADAPWQELPLVGGDKHDWATLLGRWGVIHKAARYAAVTRGLGLCVMMATLAILAYWLVRPRAPRDT